MRKIFVVISILALSLFSANAKKVLDHSSFDDWKSVRVGQITKDGSWASYMIVPQEGDAVLKFKNVKNGKEIVIERGYNPQFTADCQWAVALIKPFYKATRQAKIDGKKGYDMPQDSLAVVDLKTLVVRKIPFVKSYTIGKDGGDWIAYLSCDTAYISPKALKDKESGMPLVVENLNSGIKKVVNWVDDFSMSKNGMRIAASINVHESDSIAEDGMMLMLLPDTTVQMVDSKKCFYGAPVFNEDGSMMAFTASNDSVETGTKKAELFLSKIEGSVIDTQNIYVLQAVNEGKYPNLRPPYITDESKRDSIMAEMRRRVAAMAGDSVFVNQYSVPSFSHNGKRLFIGVAPYVAPDDTTIVDFERAELDIWRWDAPFTPPQENHDVDKARKKTYPVMIDLETGKEILLTYNPLENVGVEDRGNSQYAFIQDPSKNIISHQWDYYAFEDLYVVDLVSGIKEYIGEAPVDMADMSPNGKYVYWYDKRNIYAYDVASKKTICITDSMPYPIWDEEQDMPMERMPYGEMGWLADDAGLMIYDRHDIWLIDPKGLNAPVCITKEEGRKANRRYKYIKTDFEKRFFENGDEVLLDVFDYTTKENGFALLKIGKPMSPAIKVVDKYKFTQIRKAKEAPVYVYQKANFNTSPNVYMVSNNNFAKEQQLTDANPQMAEYNWGNAELVQWYAYNGDLTEGVLYTPEDLDPTKKYPMLVVFYEKNSEELYRHYTMEPSWSWVNYPFYVSRGYVVFVPDVHYAPGIPGESAYNYICSGVEDLCNKYEWIDKERIGIDGQSWGGYQTAFLITRTDMFACAGSGAPVSNMTSAFGGIRWESGSSRQAQYECGQSRIGRNLWEAPELYINNSPLFFLDRVDTPLLIMHNDGDGAVPWYQGIELFMGLRRLQKPVWMLQYNGEAHNIRARKNRKDITIRLQQFFDYYLKDAPMPEWMKNGIPATRKGQEMGTGYINE